MPVFCSFHLSGMSSSLEMLHCFGDSLRFYSERSSYSDSLEDRILGLPLLTIYQSPNLFTEEFEFFFMAQLLKSPFSYEGISSLLAEVVEPLHNAPRSSQGRRDAPQFPMGNKRSPYLSSHGTPRLLTEFRTEIVSGVFI